MLETQSRTKLSDFYVNRKKYNHGRADPNWNATRLEVYNFYVKLFAVFPIYTQGAEAAIAQLTQLTASTALPLPSIIQMDDGVQFKWLGLRLTLVVFKDGRVIKHNLGDSTNV